MTPSLTLFASAERIDMAALVAALSLTSHRARAVETMTEALASESALAALVDVAAAMTSRGGIA